MVTLRKQKVGKYSYWQIVESRRVNGKPRPFVVAHLGTADQLLRTLQGGPVHKKVRSASHGAVFLLYQAARELDLLRIFQETFSSQKRDGLEVGKSLLLAAIHRAVCPGSKRSFSTWTRTTTLPEFASFDPTRLDSQHFWEQMDTVTEEELATAEINITRRMIERGLIPPGLLFYDLTNFFTFIASGNQRSELAQRGWNKQKRHDLRQFGLAAVVTREFLLPVLTEVYAGNASDQERFLPFLTCFRDRLSALHLDLMDLTIVFDKGSNSKKNFAELDRRSIPYVASLSSAYHQDLLSVPPSVYREVTVGEQVIPCYRTHKPVWGKERIILITVSEKLRQGQLRGLSQALASQEEALSQLQRQLASPRSRKRQREVLERNIRSILKGEWGIELITVTLQERDPGHFALTWAIDESAYCWVTEIRFGKKILITSREEWSDEEIIAAYHGQSHIERVFRHFKNPYHHAFCPQYHWTDQKIRVHAFICIIGLLLSQLLWKKAKELGYHLSIENMIDRLDSVREAEIVTISGLKGRPVREKVLEMMDPDLEKFYQDLVARMAN